MDVRRRQVFLPQALERPAPAQACDQLRQPVEEAAAVRQVEDQNAAVVQARMAGGQGAADVGNVFDHVVEHDDVETFALIEYVREVAGANRQAARGGAGADDGIRLHAQHVELLARRLEEPAVGAAYVEQARPADADVAPGPGDDGAEVLQTQRLEAGFAFGFVHGGACMGIDGNAQGGAFIVASRAGCMPSGQASHLGVATNDTRHVGPRQHLESHQHIAIKLCIVGIL